MKKSLILAGLGVGIVAISAVSVAYAANNNYGTWRALMGDRGGRATDVVTEQNFDQFTKMHQLMADGKYAEAQQVRTDLGLGQGQGKGKGAGGCGMMKGANGAGGGCAMHKGGATQGESFVDANNNSVCDHAEQVAK